MGSLLKRIARELDREGVPYMIIGGQAVLVHGEPRFTRDIDITVALTPDSLQKVVRVVRKSGLEILTDNPEKFVRETRVLLLIDGYPVKFASPEDVIILKVISGRARDYEDIKGILRRTDIDTNYVEGWLREFSGVLQRDLVGEFRSILKMEGENKT